MFTTISKNHLLLHVVVLIFGLTGVLGKAIDAPAEVVVFYRLLIGVIGLFLFFKITRYHVVWNLKETAYVGIIVGLHWLTFFAAIKAANISIALICFSSSTFFTALLEPLYYKRKWTPYEVLLGGLVMVGLYILCKEPGQSIFDSTYGWGIMLSTISAFLASWFTVINGTLIQKGRAAKSISYVALIFALVPVVVYMVWTQPISTLKVQLSIGALDTVWLLILGLLCTSFAFIASVHVMKEVSPYTVSMSVNLEPIYSIVLATLLWPESEKMQPTFYIGALIILGLVLLNAYLKNKQRLELTNQ